MPNIPKDLEEFLNETFDQVHLMLSTGGRKGIPLMEAKARIAAYIQLRESSLRELRDKWRKLAKKAINDDQGW